MRIAVIIGTRPEAIKLLPVYLALKRSIMFDPVLIASGQHTAMLTSIWEIFHVTPDITLEIHRENSGLPELTGKLLIALGNVIAVHSFSGIIIQGDTTTALAGAMVGFYNQIKVIHVEAGLRTYDKNFPFPEEINRQLITRLSDYHFPPTQKAYSTLLHELQKETNMIITGNTVIDSLKYILTEIEKYSDQYHQKFEGYLNKPIILITGHRRENFGKAMQNIWEIIAELATDNQNYNFVFPTHLNPNIYEKVRKVLGNVSNISLIDPLPYDEMIFLMSRANLIITDSGGIQEEAPTLGIPVLITRTTTERPEVVGNKLAWLVGHDKDVIRRMFYKILNDEAIHAHVRNTPNPYGNGDAAIKIVAFLEEKFV